MYYFMRQDLFTQGLNIIEVVGHTEETAKFLWTAGNKFGSDVSCETLNLNSAYGTEMADFFDNSIPLMSSHLLDILKDLGVDNIDAYPMKLVRKDTGEEWNNFFAINVIGKVSAVDMDSSEYKVNVFGNPRFEKIIIDKNKVEDAICFRLAEYKNLIVVTESIYKELSRHNFKALFLQNTMDFSGI